MASNTRGAPKFDMKIWPEQRLEFDVARGPVPLGTWFRKLGEDEVRRLREADPGRFEEESPEVTRLYGSPTIAAQAEEALRAHGSPLDTRSLIREMRGRGYETLTRDAFQTVYRSMYRASLREDGNVEKLGSKWGLKEWRVEAPAPEDDRDAAGDSIHGPDLT